MIASHRFSFLLGLIIVAITSLIHAQESMMLRNNSAPAAGVAINRGDFNNDGKLDVAVTNIGNHSIQVMLGNGDGTFQTATTILFDQEPASITTADFNNDGK